MRKLIPVLAIFSLVLSSNSYAGNRYVKEPVKGEIGKKVWTKVSKPFKVKLPKINPDKYLKREKEKKGRYTTSFPSKHREIAPKFSLLFSEKLFKRAKCYDVLGKRWYSAERKELRGAKAYGKMGKWVVYQKGSKFCFIEIPE